MRVKYVGPYDVAEVPAHGLRVERGESVDVPNHVAEGLLEQPTNWQPAGKKPAANEED